MSTPPPTPPTPADVALLAAHVGVRQDGQSATYADAAAYLALLTPKGRQGLIADLWRRYGPTEVAHGKD